MHGVIYVMNVISVMNVTIVIKWTGAMKAENISLQPLLTTGDIARYCQTSVMQVNRWIKHGDLKAFRNPGGRHRIDKLEFLEFLKRNGMPVIDEYFSESKAKKVLIADDDESVVNALRHIIKSNYKDYDIDVAYDGYNALLKIGGFKPDILIIDIQMPKIDGMEICRRVREDKSINPEIRILVITGHSDKYDEKTVKGSGADEYLLKPFEKRSLLESIERLSK